MKNPSKPQYEHQGNELRLTYKADPDSPEVSRLYTFPGGDTIEVADVREARVSRHGYHFLVVGSGEAHVIRPTWMSMTIVGKTSIPEEYKRALPP